MRHSIRYSSTECLFPYGKKCQPGSRVFVPFGRGNRETEGYVIAIRQEADYEESKIKEILRVNTEGISVESELIQVASFLKKSMARQ